MLTSVKTAALSGIKGIEVTVEVDLSQGLPYFNIIGLADTAVKEAADRVKNALQNSGLSFPNSRITVNLSPAWIHKKGSSYDLAIAVGVLAAQGSISMDFLKGKAFAGELSLDGSIMPLKGVLPMVSGLMGKVDTFYVPEQNCREAYLLTKDTGMKIIPAANIAQVFEELSCGIVPEGYVPGPDESAGHEMFADFSEVKGHNQAKEAITVAVAGDHGLLMIGSPGTGKSMLAKRVQSILPPMSTDEIIETSMIYSLVGKLDDRNPVISRRPFRELNSRSTEASILGGGLEPFPGEISLANNGILFMDEFLEFDREKIELLRKPMEDKSITLVRRGNAYTFPARFTLLAATNPCRCGYLGDSLKQCRCTQSEIDRYRSRLSGPICERIDMFIEIVRVDYDSLNGGKSMGSAEMFERVMKAREIQKARFKNLPIYTNSQMEAGHIAEFCSLGRNESDFMERAYRRYALSPRRYHKILKLSRTMADMKGKRDIGIEELACALGYTRLIGEDTEKRL